MRYDFLWSRPHTHTQTCVTVCIYISTVSVTIGYIHEMMIVIMVIMTQSAHYTCIVGWMKGDSPGPEY